MWRARGAGERRGECGCLFCSRKVGASDALLRKRALFSSLKTKSRSTGPLHTTLGQATQPDRVRKQLKTNAQLFSSPARRVPTAVVAPIFTHPTISRPPPARPRVRPPRRHARPPHLGRAATSSRGVGFLTASSSSSCRPHLLLRRRHTRLIVRPGRPPRQRRPPTRWPRRVRHRRAAAARGAAGTGGCPPTDHSLGGDGTIRTPCVDVGIGDTARLQRERGRQGWWRGGSRGCRRRGCSRRRGPRWRRGRPRRRPRCDGDVGRQHPRLGGGQSSRLSDRASTRLTPAAPAASRSRSIPPRHGMHAVFPGRWRGYPPARHT